jgi:hypothetical protein
MLSPFSTGSSAQAAIRASMPGLGHRDTHHKAFKLGPGSVHGVNLQFEPQCLVGVTMIHITKPSSHFLGARAQFMV